MSVAAKNVDKCMRLFEEHRHVVELFRNSVYEFFTTHPRINDPEYPVIHSVKSRIKHPEHLRKKLVRKQSGGDPITPENFFERITDLAGVRVLHLHQRQFPEIATAIQEHLDRGEWVLFEKPRAYTWDPESKEFFESLGFETAVKESFYTSIHYVVKPRVESPLCCEIQIRTLFEEIWGEIDHAVNYPVQTASVACREQLRVLAKLVGTGSRLADSIFRSHDEHSSKSDALGAVRRGAPRGKRKKSARRG